MKKSFFIGAVVLLALSFGVLLVIRQPKNNTDTEMAPEDNDMDTIMVSLSKEEQIMFQNHIQTLDDEIHSAKEEGNEELVVALEKRRQDILNPTPLPDDDEAMIQYYEDGIRKARAIGDEELAAALEGWRDSYIELIAERAETDRQRQEDRARYEALTSPQERLVYHQEKLTEAEKALRLAKEEGDPDSIRMEELIIEGIKLDIDEEKRDIAWIPVEKKVDELIKWAEEQEPKWIEMYRPYLHIEVVDGKETIAGFRSPDEIRRISNNLPITDGDKIPPVPREPSDTVVPREPSETTPDLPIDLQSSESQSSTDEMSNLNVTQDVAKHNLINAQAQFKAWRDNVDTSYIDVLLSGYMTPQERDKYFPTPQDRANLTRRTTEMQKLVVSKVRDLVKEMPNTTEVQKRDLARDLVRQNFEKNFAESVLKALEQDSDE